MLFVGFSERDIHLLPAKEANKSYSNHRKIHTSSRCWDDLSTFEFLFIGLAVPTFQIT